MGCPYCSSKTEVINSRSQKRNNQVWRRRQCLSCKAVITTHEAIDYSSVLHVEGPRGPEPFVRDILYMDILGSLQGRSKRFEESIEITSTTVNKLLKLPQKPFLKPTDISKAAAEVLKRFNKQAHLRFVADHPSLQS